MESNRLCIILCLFSLIVMPPVVASEIVASEIAASKQEVTIFVDDAYKPYSFKNADGEAEGIYIDILKTAFSRMPEYAVNLEPVPWKRGKLLMERGEGLGLAPAFFHGHDWPYLYPYSLPIYDEKIISVCHESVLNKTRPNWPKDYIGLRVGNVAGFDGWGGDAFYDLVQQGKIVYEEAKGSVESIIKLGLGRVQCIMMEENAFDQEHARLLMTGEYDQEKFHALRKGAFVGMDPVYVGYSKKAILSGDYPFHMEFRQAFDTEIYKMTKSGEIRQIMLRSLD